MYASQLLYFIKSPSAHSRERVRARVVTIFLVFMLMGLASGNALANTQLTDMQKYVTQQNGTEPAYNNAYWNNHAEGIYVDIQSGEVLFSSKDKFDSGTGWPSFTKPADSKNIIQRTDDSFGMSRTEVHSVKGNSHLGHLFNDGPKDKGGLRYCINSAALRFIPKDKMMDEGYGEYLRLFEK